MVHEGDSNGDSDDEGTLHNVTAPRDRVCSNGQHAVGIVNNGEDSEAVDTEELLVVGAPTKKGKNGTIYDRARSRSSVGSTYEASLSQTNLDGDLVHSDGSHEHAVDHSNGDRNGNGNRKTSEIVSGLEPPSLDTSEANTNSPENEATSARSNTSSPIVIELSNTTEVNVVEHYFDDKVGGKSNGNVGGTVDDKDGGKQKEMGKKRRGTIVLPPSDDAEDSPKDESANRTASAKEKIPKMQNVESPDVFKSAIDMKPGLFSSDDDDENADENGTDSKLRNRLRRRRRRCSMSSKSVSNQHRHSRSNSVDAAMEMVLNHPLNEMEEDAITDSMESDIDLNATPEPLEEEDESLLPPTNRMGSSHSADEVNTQQESPRHVVGAAVVATEVML